MGIFMQKSYKAILVGIIFSDNVDLDYKSKVPPIHVFVAKAAKVNSFMELCASNWPDIQIEKEREREGEENEIGKEREHLVQR